MKKYRLSFPSGSYVEYTEYEFNQLNEINILGLADTKFKAKELLIQSEIWKYTIPMHVAIDNFEVIDG